MGDTRKQGKHEAGYLKKKLSRGIKILLASVLLVFFPGTVGVERSHCRRFVARVLAKIFFVDLVFLVNDEGHNPRCPILGGIGNEGKPSDNSFAGLPG